MANKRGWKALHFWDVDRIEKIKEALRKGEAVHTDIGVTFQAYCGWLLVKLDAVAEMAEHLQGEHHSDCPAAMGPYHHCLCRIKKPD